MDFAAQQSVLAGMVSGGRANRTNDMRFQPRLRWHHYRRGGHHRRNGRRRRGIAVGSGVSGRWPLDLPDSVTATRTYDHDDQEHADDE